MSENEISEAEILEFKRCFKLTKESVENYKKYGPANPLKQRFPGDNCLKCKFSDDGSEVLVLVKSILIMDNIGVALNNHLESALPDISNVDDGIELYVEIYGVDVFSNQVRCIFIERVNNM